jgi:Rrf2 family iron-sulfur cluster assembly transcriptional regulator
MFSRSAEYAIRALTYLAAQEPGKLSGAREIAEAESIPMPFLWKILQKLAAKKLVRSFRGVRGGYELARPPQRITLDKILKEMGESESLERCILGFAQCREKNPCPLHQLWAERRKNFTGALRNTTLSDLSAANHRAAGK